MIDLSIVLPCYNEANNIPIIIERFLKVLPDDLKVEIVLVNNGSNDHSKVVFERELSRLKSHPFKVIDLPVNKGYGFGILSGLDQASGEVLAWTHADMQTDPGDVIRAYNQFLNAKNGNVFVKGRRKKRAFLEVFFTFGMQILVWLILRQNLSDINAQPKVFSKRFYQDYLKKQSPYDFSLDLFAYYQAKKTLKIIEVPVYFKKRLHGIAKGGGSLKTRIKLIQRTLLYIIKLKDKIKEQD